MTARSLLLATATDDALAWQIAVVANGGTVSAGRLTIVNNFIAAEKAAGTWALTDDYWPLWAENTQQALTSLKQRRLAAGALPVFTVDRGYTYNGTSNFTNTGFNPSTHAISMTGSEQRIAVYERTDVSTNTVAIGVFNASTRQLNIRPRSGTTMVAFANTTTGANFTLPLADSRGWSSASRTGGGTTVKGYKNGVAMADATGLTVANSQPSNAIYIGAVDSAGTAGTFRAASIGFACVGAPLSDAQELAQYNNVQAWAAAIGASIDVDAVAWSTQVVTNGGTVSQARFDIVNQFIIAEKSAGTWALTDDYWPLWAENAPQALTSLKQRRLVTAVAAPTFTADRGYTFDGTTNYLRTGFIPSSHVIVASGTSGHMAVYCRTDAAAGFDFGVNITATVNWTLRCRNAATMTSSLNSTSTAGIASATAVGFNCGTRTGNTFEGWKNGVSIGTYVPGSFPTGALPGQELYVGAVNTSGSPTTFTTRQIGFLAVGAALNAAQNLARYNNVQAWATAINASISADVDVRAWVDQVVANGGTVSGARAKIVEDFVTAEKAAGTWALTDDYWGLWAENTQQALTSLKQRRLATAVNAPAFVVDRGYVSDGTTSYINSGFICSTHAVQMTGINMRIGAYVRTNNASANVAAGVVHSSTQNLQIIPRSATNFMTVQLNSQAPTPSGDTVLDNRGYTVGNRTNGSTAANITAYKNGAAFIPSTPGTLAGVLPTQPVFINARSDGAGAPAAFYTGQVAFVTVGGTVSAAQEAAQYSNVQAWATSVGAQV